jgi:hypothetical protein
MSNPDFLFSGERRRMANSEWRMERTASGEWRAASGENGEW